GGGEGLWRKSNRCVSHVQRFSGQGFGCNFWRPVSTPSRFSDHLVPRRGLSDVQTSRSRECPIRSRQKVCGSTSSMTALQKYEARADAIDSLLCVGLDPDFMNLPDHFQRRSYPQFEFCRYLIDSTHACTAAYKLNIAFFQARGMQGFQELKLITDYLRSTHPDILLLCDAKHGDTFNTNIQYAASVFDCFGFDGVTVHPYMGGDALTPFLQRQDKAIIVLCLNPGGRGFQSLSTAGGKPLWQAVAEMVCGEWNQFGNCMLVI